MPRRDHFLASLGRPRHRNCRVTASDRDPHPPTPKAAPRPFHAVARDPICSATSPLRSPRYAGNPAKESSPAKTKDSSSGSYGIFAHTFSSAARYTTCTHPSECCPDKFFTRGTHKGEARKTRQRRPRLKLCNQSFRLPRVVRSTTVRTATAGRTQADTARKDHHVDNTICG